MATVIAPTLPMRGPARTRIEPVAAERATRVLVSIHDVTPAHWAAVKSLWSSCRAVGVTPALLVVPEWHGTWPIERHEAFVAWLHRRVDDGADVLLHGLRHDEHGAWRTWRDHLRALGRTDGEGEFLTLPQAAARVRIHDGLARLRGLALDPIGFVPPAWLMRAETLGAAAAEGLALAEDVGRLYLLRASRPMLGPRVRSIPSAAWRWSGRSAWRAWTSAVVASARWRAMPVTSDRVLRVALHPGDLAHDATRRSLHDTLARLATHARWCRYRDLLPSSGTLGDIDGE
ncbi:MAG: DUF2334 domain-containing protein [Gemmatirosa sp.]|nr:DUF2334 domain-containing protein [Gemmatirosa sp.]